MHVHLVHLVLYLQPSRALAGISLRQVELLSGPKYGNMSNMCIYTHAQTNTVTHVDRKLEADVVAIYRPGGKRILSLLDSEFVGGTCGSGGAQGAP